MSKSISKKDYEDLKKNYEDLTSKYRELQTGYGTIVSALRTNGIVVQDTVFDPSRYSHSGIVGELSNKFFDKSINSIMISYFSNFITAELLIYENTAEVTIFVALMLIGCYFVYYGVKFLRTKIPYVAHSERWRIEVLYNCFDLASTVFMFTLIQLLLTVLKNYWASISLSISEIFACLFAIVITMFSWKASAKYKL